jgi:uncharacterized membrane protein YkgB
MDTHERHVAHDYSHIAYHIAAAIAVIFFAVLVVYILTGQVKATPFDADGVRCYSRALTMTCVKTANP